MAERLVHLEALVDPDMSEQEIMKHRNIASWIGQFFDEFSGIRTHLEEAREAQEDVAAAQEPFLGDSPFPEVGGTDYMEGDSGSYVEVEINGS